jgi:nucleoside-triphosphatase THEP1
MRPTVADLPTDRVVVDVATGDSRPLTVPLGTPGAIPAGTAAYDPAALEWADEVTGRAHAHADVLIVDEIGALEIEGRGGLVGAMQLATNARRAVFTVRAGLVSAFLAKIGVGTTPVLAVAGGEIPAQVEELEKALHL